MTILKAIIAVIVAIPTIKGWFDSLVKMYVEQQIASWRAEDRAAIKKAIDEQDQRDIEKALGSSHAGEPSGIPGTEIRETLPGVKP